MIHFGATAMRFILFYIILSSATILYGVQTSLRAASKKYKEHTPHASYVWKNHQITSSSTVSTTKNVGIVETPSIKPLGYVLDGDIKVFRLTAQPVEQLITDGTTQHHQLIHAMKNILGIKTLPSKKKIQAWGYNGSTPGPTIELIQGDRVRVIFKNELPEPTLIHWHGLEYPSTLDHSSDRNPVLPGETHIYEFTAFQEGTYLYHSGYSIAKQNRYGLVGMVIIHPQQYEEPIDRHIALIIQEWALSSDSLNPNTVTNHFNWFTLNGRSAPSIPLITLKQGERIRLHVGSLATQSYQLFLHGYTWTVVGTEGGPIQRSAQVRGASLHLTPGSTRTIEFSAWNPGVWPCYVLAQHEELTYMTDTSLEVTPHGGIFTMINVHPSSTDTTWSHYSQSSQ